MRRTRPATGVAAPPRPESIRPQPAARTPLGTVGSPRLALVDAAGRVGPRGAGWHLDWWVGADDRWHLPHEERAVRQHLVDGAPVVETAMRIPSGDAVHRCWAVPGPGGPTVVVEVENTSPVPVALALVVAGDGEGGPPKRLALDGVELQVEGRPAVVLAKAPNRVAGDPAGVHGLRAVVTAGDAGEHLDGPVVAEGPDGAALAVVVPLPHRASLRVRLPLGTDAVAAEPVPDPDAVARGWRAQAERGARLVLPDERLDEALAASRRSALLWAQASGDLPFAVAAELATGLARIGIGDEALAVLAEVTDRPGAARALSRRTRDERARAAWVGAVERTRDAVGDDALAESLGGAPKGTAPSSARPGVDLDVALSWLGLASPTWGWAEGAGGTASPTLVATFLGLVVDGLVHEAEHGLALLPAVPDSWLGQGVEVHDLPTRRGLVSFAVRWHGERPALLWDRRPAADAEDLAPALLTAPGLDPSWSTDEPRGEALLAAPR